MSVKLMDVSQIQGKPHWDEIKTAGYAGAGLRIRNSKGVDTSWEYNYKSCGEQKLARGAYRYSYALTAAQAKAEAQEVLRTLDGRKIELGVWLDLEWNKQRELGSRKVKQIANAWMKVIRSAGYECNVYCNLDWFRNVCGGLDAQYWIARYPQHDTGVLVESLKPNIGEAAWQYTSKGRVPGISGDVDLDEWYALIPTIPPAENPQNPYKDSGRLLKYNPLTVGIPRDDVRWLQWELRESGYQIQVDGKFGPKTELALRGFQASHGLTVDGKCGAKTRAALIAAGS